MPALITDETPIVVPPSYSCFFEHAEHMLDSWFHGREPVEDNLTAAIVQTQDEAREVFVRTLDRALRLPELQRRVRLGMLLQKDLLEAFDAISVRRG